MIYTYSEYKKDLRNITIILIGYLITLGLIICLAVETAK